LRLCLAICVQVSFGGENAVSVEHAQRSIAGPVQPHPLVTLDRLDVAFRLLQSRTAAAIGWMKI
jgi:hypothetical protein